MPIKPDFDAAEAAEDWIFNQKPPSVREQVQRAVKEWDESKHKRQPAGSEQGGEFTSTGDLVIPKGMRIPQDTWDQPRNLAESKFFDRWRAHQEQVAAQRAKKKPPVEKLGPGMLMAGVPKSWNRLGGKKELEVGRPGRGISDPIFLKITRWDDTVTKVIQKMPWQETTVEVEAELANEAWAYELSNVLGGSVPHTEFSGLLMRQEFIPGKTLVEEMAERLNALSDDEFNDKYGSSVSNLSRAEATKYVLDNTDADILMDGGANALIPGMRQRLSNPANAVIDFLMDQSDRNTGNILFRESDGQLVLIDNGNSADASRTANFVRWKHPRASSLIYAQAGKKIPAEMVNGLKTIQANSNLPEAIRFRAEFLLKYGRIPFREPAAQKTWETLFDEYERRPKK